MIINPPDEFFIQFTFLKLVFSLVTTKYLCRYKHIYIRYTEENLHVTSVHIYTYLYIAFIVGNRI